MLLLRDGRLHYVYNFMGEEEQPVSAPQPVPAGNQVPGVRYERAGTVEGSHTPPRSSTCPARPIIDTERELAAAFAKGLDEEKS